LNRINAFIILFVSGLLTALVVFLFVRENLKVEPQTLQAPLKVEAYRIDRFPLPGADVYLNQRFLGRTNREGYYARDMTFMQGESYTLVVEKDREGFNYGPWQTSFTVAREEPGGKQRKQKKNPPGPMMDPLEGEFDVALELERAQQGRVSQHEKFHFLAIVDGTMYYTVRVSGKNDEPVPDASVLVNGKLEGVTNLQGRLTVSYSGAEHRRERIEVLKKGEHQWRKEVEVFPDATVRVALDQLLLLDIRACSEMYGSMRGITGVQVHRDDTLLGETGDDGRLSTAYENHYGVDGSLELRLSFPSGYHPHQVRRAYRVTPGLPRLTDSFFAYPADPMPPRIAVLPLEVEEKDPLLRRRARDLGARIEDYLSVGEAFTMVDAAAAEELLWGHELDVDRKTGWEGRPSIKRELDGVVFGSLEKKDGDMFVRVAGMDYRGELVTRLEREVALRELEFTAESFAGAFRRNFSLEGVITQVGEAIRINLGERQGVSRGNKFFSYVTSFDDVQNDYTRRRVAKLQVTETGSEASVCAPELVNEGFLLEPGGKVKRYSEPAGAPRQVLVTLTVASGGEPVAGANVYLDDRWSGQTDAGGGLRLSLPGGTHADILVYKEGYIPVRRELGEQETAVLSVELVRGQSLFLVDSRPRGGLVFIDGQFQGETPITRKPLEVPYGFHLVEVKMEGYKDYRQYLSFDRRKVELTGRQAVELHQDYYAQAEASYRRGLVQQAIETLRTVTADHPDYLRALEFLGYLYLNEIQDYQSAIDYYNRVLDLPGSGYQEDRSVVSYYNIGKAYHRLADSLFYTERARSRVNYLMSVKALKIVRERRGRLPVQDRGRVFQDALFYLSLSFQKLYYITQEREYLDQAHYLWIDYFDYFKPELARDDYFRNQRSVAENYRNEVERLQGER
jgi:hypothetical protein